MDDLERLILFLKHEFEIISNKWEQNVNYRKMNMKKNLVHDLYTNEQLILNVLNYRNFIDKIFDDMYIKINKLKINNVTFRVKAVNSIQYKIENYEKNHECGKIPINKCLNDLLGFRIICENSIEYKEIYNMISKKFPDIKCVLADKGDYIATHLYFIKGNNYVFPWELQIWNKANEKNNYLSHFKYKQDYTKWENKLQGGV